MLDAKIEIRLPSKLKKEVKAGLGPIGLSQLVRAFLREWVDDSKKWTGEETLEFLKKWEDK